MIKYFGAVEFWENPNWGSGSRVRGLPRAMAINLTPANSDDIVYCRVDSAERKDSVPFRQKFDAVLEILLEPVLEAEDEVILADDLIGKTFLLQHGSAVLGRAIINEKV